MVNEGQGHPVQADPPPGRIVEPLQQSHYGALAPAAGPRQGHLRRGGMPRWARGIHCLHWKELLLQLECGAGAARNRRPRKQHFTYSSGAMIIFMLTLMQLTLMLMLMLSSCSAHAQLMLSSCSAHAPAHAGCGEQGPQRTRRPGGTCRSTPWSTKLEGREG